MFRGSVIPDTRSCDRGKQSPHLPCPFLHGPLTLSPVLTLRAVLRSPERRCRRAEACTTQKPDLAGRNPDMPSAGARSYRRWLEPIGRVLRLHMRHGRLENSTVGRDVAFPAALHSATSPHNEGAFRYAPLPLLM